MAAAVLLQPVPPRHRISPRRALSERKAPVPRFGDAVIHAPKARKELRFADMPPQFTNVPPPGVVHIEPPPATPRASPTPPRRGVPSLAAAEQPDSARSSIPSPRHRGPPPLSPRSAQGVNINTPYHEVLASLKERQMRISYMQEARKQADVDGGSSARSSLSARSSMAGGSGVLMRHSTLELAKRAKMETALKDKKAGVHYARIGAFKDADEDALDPLEEQKWARAETRLDEFMKATAGTTPLYSIRAWKHASAVEKLQRGARHELRLLALASRLDAAKHFSKEKSHIDGKTV